MASLRQRTTAGAPSAPSASAPRPFLKWAGGKQQLLPALLEAVPDQYERYFEPFIGGGALFFALAHAETAHASILGDANAELIATYEAVRSDLEPLVLRLRRLERAYLAQDSDGRAALYYRVRESRPRGRAAIAARFIFLNKTCYNGLYRVNSRGLFNVPHGRYRAPKILDRGVLEAASRALASAELACRDFEATCADAREGDFVYFDPPFHPLSVTSSFTQYTSTSFGWADQERLRAAIDRLTERGVHVLLSDSPHPRIVDLYESGGYELRRIPARRAINSKAAGRGAIDELLVGNRALLARRRSLSRPTIPPSPETDDGSARGTAARRRRTARPR